MRILYLSARQCWPVNSGGKLRDYRLLLPLARASELTYVYYSEPGAPAVAASDLEFCRRVVSVPRPPRYRPDKIVRGLAGRWPLPIVNYTSEAMIGAVRGLLRENRFDLVHLDSFHLAACEAAFRSELGGAAAIYGWHDIPSELMRRYGSMSGPVARRFYARYTARRMERVESEILKTAFGHIVCSEREREVLLERWPKARIAVIENGVDTRAYSPEGRVREPKRIVFVGAMHYYANVDAVTWFAQRVWPEIHRRFPEYRFTIVGVDPKPAVLALRAIAGVEVTGTVESVAPYYREAFAAVVPLRVGTGTRLKILEAMAAGVPVISTVLGAEGLAVSAGKNILLAESEPEWVEALEWLQERERSNRMAAAGRDLVCSRYDWQTIGDKLAETYREWLTTR